MVRKLSGFDVIQRTKDGYFDGNKLLDQWNKGNNNVRRRKMVEFLEYTKTKEFISEITNQSRENDKPDIQAVNIIKGRTNKNGSKSIDQVWMHPYLFIDFAMWINPTFKYKVIQFIFDQLIDFRNNAGDNYKGLTNAITIFEPSSSQYMQLAKGLNWIIFNRHENGIRQKATQGQLKELIELQKMLSFAVNMGYIRSFDELLNEMRRIYNNRSNGK